MYPNPNLIILLDHLAWRRPFLDTVPPLRSLQDRCCCASHTPGCTIVAAIGVVCDTLVVCGVERATYECIKALRTIETGVYTFGVEEAG